MDSMNTGTRPTPNCLVARCKEQTGHTDRDIVVALVNRHVTIHTAYYTLKHYTLHTVH